MDILADVLFESTKAINTEDLQKHNLGLPRFTVNRSIGRSDVVDRMRENIVSFPNVTRFRCRTKVAICGYGPSLNDTIGEIDRTMPVMTTSGAHDLLIKNGIIPTWHVECDPRPHKIFFVKNSHPDVTYLLASVCHPDMFKMLLDAGRKVQMWHAVTDIHEEQLKMLREIEYGAHMVGGGSNAGLRALLLAYHMGFRDIDCFGLDFSYRGKQIWAGEHSGEEHSMIEVECNGKAFYSSDIMINACQDFFELMHSRYLGGTHFILHGDGLLAERVIMSSKDMVKATHHWVKPLLIRPLEAA